ncbi:MAG: hypothetical protein U9Q70_00840 [Chloroflexota bacterium]|nr:hypothetical protein [Chloroflexota bacterium]
MEMLYYLANGIKVSQADTHNFFIQKVSASLHFTDRSLSLCKNCHFYFPGDEIFHTLDSECVSLYDIVIDKIFPDIDEYYRFLKSTPIWMTSAGHDSDFRLSQSEFEKLVNGLGNENHYRLLFLADCNALISYLQNRIIGSKAKFIHFYISFCNCEPFILKEDGTFWLSGENTTIVFSLLNDLIINLYSILDLVTKVAYQFEHIPEEFNSYQRQKALKILYGDRKKLKKTFSKEDTLFENVPTLKLVENLRHELIHNGSWEAMPKLFYKVEGGKVKEKWIFMQDEDNGNLVAYKNRKRFFSQNNKINQRLPSICMEFWSRLLNTILQLRES